MKRVLSIAIMSLVSIPAAALAEDCSTYPYGDGINAEQVTGGTKIVSTASVSVDFDDVDAVNDSRMEAELLAKAKITKFLSEEIKSDESIDKAVETTKSMQGDSKQVAREETKKSLRSLGGSSAVLLKGVQNLGSCLTPNKELRVSVGIKPETIAAAEKLAANLNGSSGSVANSVGASVGEAVDHAHGKGMQPVAGFSDTSKLAGF